MMLRSTSPQAASVRIADAAEMHRMDLSNVGPPSGGPLLAMPRRAPPYAPFRTLLAGSVHVRHHHCPESQAGNNKGCDLAKFHLLLTPEQEAVSATYATIRLVASTTAAARRAAAAKKKAPASRGSATSAEGWPIVGTPGENLRSYGRSDGTQPSTLPYLLTPHPRGSTMP